MADVVKLVSKRALEEETRVKSALVDDILDRVVTVMNRALKEEGFDFSTTGEYNKKATLVVESLRALAYSRVGLYHPLQALAEAVIAHVDSDMVDFVDEINLRLT